MERKELKTESNVNWPYIVVAKFGKQWLSWKKPVVCFSNSFPE